MPKVLGSASGDADAGLQSRSDPSIDTDHVCGVIELGGLAIEPQHSRTADD